MDKIFGKSFRFHAKMGATGKVQDILFNNFLVVLKNFPF